MFDGLLDTSVYAAQIRQGEAGMYLFLAAVIGFLADVIVFGCCICFFGCCI